MREKDDCGRTTQNDWLGNGKWHERKYTIFFQTYGKGKLNIN